MSDPKLPLLQNPAIQYNTMSQRLSPMMSRLTVNSSADHLTSTPLPSDVESGQEREIHNTGYSSIDDRVSNTDWSDDSQEDLTSG